MQPCLQNRQLSGLAVRVFEDFFGNLLHRSVLISKIEFDLVVLKFFKFEPFYVERETESERARKSERECVCERVECVFVRERE